eukprot:GHVN01078663.1.p1 GENE.GHVN01078663.1~~GHVN01078663.1.p1  ORF type:complete len:146 (+),score=22.18 GHVN01078663.1:122-559(+)
MYVRSFTPFPPHPIPYKILGISIDSKFVHHQWRSTPLDRGGIGELNFPLLSDVARTTAKDYGVLLEEGMSLRGLFLIDPQGVVRHGLVNDLPLGRSVDEAIRLVDALQFHEMNGEVCPADWRPGKQAMKPTAEGVAKYLSQTFGK